MRRTITILLCTLACLAFCGTALAGTPFLVGAAEDGAKQLDPAMAKAKMDLAALAGFDAIRLTAQWQLGEREIGDYDRITLGNAAVAAAADGIRLIVAIYPSGSSQTPLSDRDRSDFAAYASSVAEALPTVQDFVIGNEPNLNRFWLPQFTRRGTDYAASAYELLLAKTYDALKDVSADVRVIGGAVSARGSDDPRGLRPTHSPVQFLLDLGVAYRRTGRARPIMDALVLHPYLDSSRQSPTFRHPHSTTIGIADYAKLESVLRTAFDGTAQPGSTLPILYGEFGVQTRIGVARLAAYTAMRKGMSKVTQHPDAVPEAIQAQTYREALELASCQRNVLGLLFLHVSDERSLAAWQSGVYYADDAPKSSLPAIRNAALAARADLLTSCR